MFVEPLTEAHLELLVFVEGKCHSLILVSRTVHCVQKIQITCGSTNFFLLVFRSLALDLVYDSLEVSCSLLKNIHKLPLDKQKVPVTE